MAVESTEASYLWLLNSQGIILPCSIPSTVVMCCISQCEGENTGVHSHEILQYSHLLISSAPHCFSKGCALWLLWSLVLHVKLPLVLDVKFSSLFVFFCGLDF